MPYRPVSALSSAMLVVALFLAAGCDNAASSASAPEVSFQSEMVDPNAAESPAQEPPARAHPVMSESDRLVLRQMERACKNGDAKGYVDAFIALTAARRAYLAPMVNYSAQGSSTPIRLERAEYDRFPIEMFDYYRRPVQPRGPDDYIEIVVDQSRSNQIAVEWTKVRYDGEVGEGDGLGTPYTLDGKPYQAGSSSADGKLLFEPANGCWQLVEDIRYTKQPVSSQHK